MTDLCYISKLKTKTHFLTHCFPMFPFYTTWKYQRTLLYTRKMWVKHLRKNDISNKDERNRPASLRKISLFHRCFLHILRVKSKVFWYFQGVWKGYVRKKWVNYAHKQPDWNIPKNILFLKLRKFCQVNFQSFRKNYSHEYFWQTALFWSNHWELFSGNRCSYILQKS